MDTRINIASAESLSDRVFATEPVLKTIYQELNNLADVLRLQAVTRTSRFVGNRFLAEDSRASQAQQDMRAAYLLLRDRRPVGPLNIEPRVMAALEAIGNDAAVARRLNLTIDRPEPELQAAANTQPLLAQSLHAAIAENNRLHASYYNAKCGFHVCGLALVIFIGAAFISLTQDKNQLAYIMFGLTAASAAGMIYAAWRNTHARSALVMRNSERATQIETHEREMAELMVSAQFI